MSPEASRGPANFLLADTSEEGAHCFQGAKKTKEVCPNLD